MKEIIEAVRATAKEENRLTRKLCIYMFHRYSGARLKEIGEVFGVGAAGISQESRRFAAIIREDDELKKVVIELRNRMKCVNV